MRYSMLAGGKRVRPTLCMEMAWVFGEDPARVLPSAAAIELIHTYSLIHDDLPAMDDDDFRRGRPDGPQEVRGGDGDPGGRRFLRGGAHPHHRPPGGHLEQVLEVVRELADSTGVNGMVGGQVMDMDQTGVGGKTDPETLHMIHKYKTGALIKSAARIGAILAGASRGRAGRGLRVRLGARPLLPDSGRRPQRHLDARGARQERRQRRRAGQGHLRRRLRPRGRQARGGRGRREGPGGALEGRRRHLGAGELALFVRHRES